MSPTMEHTMSTTKSETIAAIRRLAPSASAEFLDNFSERQLQSFLERLEEVESRYRGTTSKKSERRGHNPSR
jgi:hypothetical protein